MYKNKHYYISLIKSLIRIFGCIISIIFGTIKSLAIALLFAELLGILEEVEDDRV